VQTGTKVQTTFLVNSTGYVPFYEIDRQDSDEMRRKILSILYAEWKKMGFSKETLFYLKKNARDGKPFTMNKHVRERLAEWGRLNEGNRST